LKSGVQGAASVENGAGFCFGGGKGLRLFVVVAEVVQAFVAAVEGAQL
jgi:hypothetical protein